MTPEIDFTFSDGTDYLFSDGTDYVFLEERILQTFASLSVGFFPSRKFSLGSVAPMSLGTNPTPFKMHDGGSWGTNRKNPSDWGRGKNPLG